MRTILRSELAPLLVLAGVVLVAPVTVHGAVAWPDETTRSVPPGDHAAPGSPAGEDALGDAYLYGLGRAKDEAQAAYWYEKAAEGGDAHAQNQIGYCYQLGIGVAVDAARALHWYQLAAATGLPAAKVNLAVAFLHGMGVPADPALAAQLFREAAVKGDGRAASYLGNQYYFGEGVLRSTAEAERWYRAAVKLHDPMGYYDLGTLYSEAEDHARDLPKAAEWLRRSAALGYVPAMHSLGLLLVNHPELPQSPSEAVSLLQEASRDGQWKSSAALAVLERDGRRTGRDPASAYYHFLLASYQGGAPAQKLVAADLKVLGRQLGAERAAATGDDARVWFQQHPRVFDFIYKPGSRQPAIAHLAPMQDASAAAVSVAPPS